MSTIFPGIETNKRTQRYPSRCQLLNRQWTGYHCITISKRKELLSSKRAARSIWSWSRSIHDTLGASFLGNGAVIPPNSSLYACAFHNRRRAGRSARGAAPAPRPAARRGHVRESPGNGKHANKRVKLKLRGQAPELVSTVAVDQKHVIERKGFIFLQLSQRHKLWKKILWRQKLSTAM